MRKKISKFFYKSLAYIVRILLRLFWDYRVYGIENLPEPPYLITANHLSLLDPILIGAIYNFRLYYLAKEELFKFPLTRPILKWLGAVNVDRKEFKKESWKKIKELIEKRNILVIFPEGTRNVNPERGLLSFKAGAATLSLQYGLKIVPIGIIGTDKIWRRGKIFPRFDHKLIVKIGKPIDVPQVLKPTKEDIIKINYIMKETIFKLIT
ncbi:MAG: 1-acyl-sn-glycerol-3-phosphate acyltransferase [Dictyoglomaceae bacterium]|nr:1-acyl-sn-glycerol-3-phosphate acyltransferase [Dictyoglomaceae bacterium]